MNRMRLRIAERLKQAQNTAASLSTFQEVDMSSLMEFRSKYKDEYLKKTGIKIGFMGAFARACTLAMKDIPAVNAGIEGPDGGDTIVYHDYVDISVAVATEKGLTTPIVRNVESMNLLEVEKVISDLGKRARDGKLTIEDMAGGTFTISNGGVFGSLMSTPIINPPQAGKFFNFIPLLRAPMLILRISHGLPYCARCLISLSIFDIQLFLSFTFSFKTTSFTHLLT
jgi:2-oxoglutarate dehydrogenase E2 component (dihydrolipoamide succinyltransferase)